MIMSEERYKVSHSAFTAREERFTVHSSHNESDLRSISGTRKVRVDLLRFMLVEGDKAVENVVASRGIVGSTWSHS